MHIYLVQHGEAKSEQEDPARPLSQRGRETVSKVAAFAAACGKLKVGSVQHSCKARAAETARILREYIYPVPAMLETDGLQPRDDPALWAGRLATINTDCMLVGHLPHLAKLAGLLLCGSADADCIEFSMGGIVCLHRTENGFALTWMVSPDMLPLCKDSGHAGGR